MAHASTISPIPFAFPTCSSSVTPLSRASDYVRRVEELEEELAMLRSTTSPSGGESLHLAVLEKRLAESEKEREELVEREKHYIEVDIPRIIAERDEASKYYAEANEKVNVLLDWKEKVEEAVAKGNAQMEALAVENAALRARLEQQDAAMVEFFQKMGRARGL